jgi:hypothetical protein
MTKTLQEELFEQMWYADESKILVEGPRVKEKTNDTELKMETEFQFSKSLQSLEKMNCNVTHFRQSEITYIPINNCCKNVLFNLS